MIEDKNRLPKNTAYLDKYVVILSVCLAAGWILYLLFGHYLVKAIYEEKFPEAINSIMRDRSNVPLESYLSKADRVFFALASSTAFALFSIVFIFSILKENILSRKSFLLMLLVLSFARISNLIDLRNINGLFIFDDYPKYYYYALEDAGSLLKHGSPFGFNHNFQGGIPALYLRSCFLELIPFSLLFGNQAGYQLMLISFILLIPVSFFCLILELIKEEEVTRLASFILTFFFVYWGYLYYGMTPATVAIPLSFLSLLFFIKYIKREGYPLLPSLLFSGLLAYTHLVIFVITWLFFLSIFLYNQRESRQRKLSHMVKRFVLFCLLNLLVCAPLLYNIINYASFLTTDWGYFESLSPTDTMRDIFNFLTHNASLNNPLFLSIFILILLYYNLKGPKEKIIIRNALIFSIIIFFLGSLKYIPHGKIFAGRIDVTFTVYVTIFNLALFMLLKNVGRPTKILCVMTLIFFALTHYSSPKHYIIQTAKAVPEIDTKIASFVSAGDYILFENAAHMDPSRYAERKDPGEKGARKKYDRCEPSERGHWEGLLQKELGIKFFSNMGEDAHPYNNLRNMYVTNGLYEGEPLNEDNGKKLIELLKSWGVNKACVWSATAKDFFNKSSYFKPLGDSNKYSCYEALYKIAPEVSLDKNGKGRITEEGPFSFTLLLEDITEEETVTLNKNYFNFWSACDDVGNKIALKKQDQKISFQASHGGYIYFKYNKNMPLNLISILALLFVFVSDFLWAGLIRNRHI